MNQRINSGRVKGFTLIELLIVIAIIAILASILLPVLAKAHRKALRAVDINNMREISQGSFMYASDFSDWFPVCTLGGGNATAGSVNTLSGIHYTRYLAIQPEWANQHWSGIQVLTTEMRIPTQYEPYDQNAGLLYGGGQVANPNAFFCPLLEDPTLTTGIYTTNTYNGATQYGTGFMSSDNGDGVVRSPYMFNPRISSPGPKLVTTSLNLKRKYQKTTDARQLDVFLLDYIEAGTSTSANSASGTGVNFSPQDWAQWPSKGIEVTFTDGSVHYINLNIIAAGSTSWFQFIINNLDGGEDLNSYQGYDQIFTVCQNAK